MRIGIVNDLRLAVESLRRAVATPGLRPDGGVLNAEPLVAKIRTIGVIAGIGAAATARQAAPSAIVAAAVAVGPLAAIGASTGGPQALSTGLRSLPRPVPWPIVLVQHVDTAFAPGLAQWLGRQTGQRVEIAGDGDAPRAERVILAATADHVVLDGTGRLHYTPEPLDHPYRPSVDVFFSSPVEARAAPGVAVLLTGMGRDGAAGLVGLRSAGWHTVAQDKATSVVWGMPGAAVEIGAAVETLPVDSIGAAIATRMPARCGETRRTP